MDNTSVVVESIPFLSALDFPSIHASSQEKLGLSAMAFILVKAVMLPICNTHVTRIPPIKSMIEPTMENTVLLKGYQSK